MISHWRMKAGDVCDKVLKETWKLSPDEFKAALSAAYPFGPRQGHPYKMWLAQVKVYCTYRARVIAMSGDK